MLSWFVAKTRPRKEVLAEINLRHQGIRTFLPRLAAGPDGQRLDHRAHHVPLFPGYVFLQTGPDPALWRAANATMGVAYVVWGTDRAPCAVPPAIMADLLRHCADGVLTPKVPGKGDLASIARGPFAGFTGIVQDLDENGRVRVLLDVLGGAVTQLALGDLAAA